MRKLRGQHILTRLVPAVVRFIIDEAAAHLHEFEQLKALASAVPFFELARPRNLASLRDSGDAIVGLVTMLRDADPAST